MAPHNSQWEDQIKGFRKNRRLLVARGIPFSATRAAFETDLRAKLTKPDSVIFFWPSPSPSSANYNNPAHQNRSSKKVCVSSGNTPTLATAVSTTTAPATPTFTTAAPATPAIDAPTMAPSTAPFMAPTIAAPMATTPAATTINASSWQLRPQPLRPSPRDFLSVASRSDMGARRGSRRGGQEPEQRR
ncbi:hypothetical protein G7Z17_g6900 [Cylindrodendrum hubeiense]|uniref:Uncharacterized protein n=1 Tax=Cylindrodendrum hubeiense TaxID=595255 RepID=A0A9P5H4K0_9HYPO|nr:hypothetical protein G7Z17_g6900 [Cylindrodendrum hubeiense]